MGQAIKVEGLGKRFLLGETFESTLSSRLGQLLRGRFRPQRGKSVEEFWALRDVEFEVAEGEAVGIIGGNGAGKSTLLKVLSRITPPTEGRARVKGRLSSLLEVGTGFHPELTGRENVFLNGAILGMRKAEVERKFEEIVAFAGVEKFIDTPVKRYSSGMYVRLAFAVAAHLEPDVLIIDEVLAVGDAEFQKRCLGKMNDVASAGRTVLFVSHNMAAVQKLCSRVLWMRGGQLAGDGEPESVIRDYQESASQRRTREDNQEPGYLFYGEAADEQADAWVFSVQLLDVDGNPLEHAATMEKLRLRIGFESRLDYRSLAVGVRINSIDGVPLLRSSTSPIHQRSFPVSPGRYHIDCVFEEFPLAAGDYILGLNLSIPRIEHVWSDDAICRLTVSPRDIFGSGQPPNSRLYFVASRHDWSEPVQSK